MRLGVISDVHGNLPALEAVLADMPPVDALVCADDGEAFKPDDAPFDAITDAVPAEEYVMVGDNVNYDIRPAADRGYRTVFVGDAADAQDLADHRVSDPSDLATMPTVMRP